MNLIKKPFKSIEQLQDHFFESLHNELFSSATSDYAILISGGKTPLPVYNRLAQLNKKCNPHAHIIFADDRHVPRTSPDSNYGNTQPMFTALGISPDRIYGINPDLPLEESAADFAQHLNQLFFDSIPIKVGFLGLGPDGHTCSLFSTFDAKRTDTLAFAAPNHLGLNRVTVSRNVLESTDRLILLVDGESKREALTALIHQPQTIPAGVALSNHPNVEIWSTLF